MRQEGDSALQDHALRLEGSEHQWQVPGTQPGHTPPTHTPQVLAFQKESRKEAPAHTTSHSFISSAGYPYWPLTHSVSCFSLSQGDSGAPMVCANWKTRRLFQVGVFSWGVTSGFRGRPGVFVSVAQFTPWILEETQREGRALTLSKAPRTPLTCVPCYSLLLSLGSQILFAAMFAGDKSDC